MKKLLILLFLLFSTHLFAAPCLDSGKIAEIFYEKGFYVKYYENKNNVYFAPKSSILGIHLDEDQINFHLSDKDIFNIDEDYVEFHLSRYSVSQDEKGNIIITRK